MSYNNALIYLTDNIGIVTDLGQVDTSSMPFYLKTEFEYRRIEILRKKIILAILRISGDITIDRLKKRKNTMMQFINSDESVVFVFDEITNYQRRRLIEEQLSFVVLGKTIFILELGTIFSERTIAKYHRQVNLKEEQMKPTTQALFLYLIRTQDFSSSMTEIAIKLSVSIMSISRAFADLRKLGLIKQTNESENTSYKLNGKRSEVWDKALPAMASPVFKTVYVDQTSLEKEQIELLSLSGESALSRYSMLSAPKNTVYGIHKNLFAAKFKNVIILPIRDENTITIQLLTHSLFTRGGCFDELSTALILIDEPDERVNGEVESMLDHYFGEEVTNE
ncbi:MAG TPA: hypothetical protein DEA52_06450 [Clostridiaceae bacterium]|nr:hypothetical protein [Clostridiaceae bacterium]